VRLKVVVERIRAMYGRQARGWSPLLVKVAVVKPFGTTVKKEEKKGRNVGKNLWICSGRRGM